MDGSGQKEVFGRNKKLKRVTVLVTDGKGDGRRMLIFGTFSFNVLSFEPRLSLWSGSPKNVGFPLFFCLHWNDYLIASLFCRIMGSVILPGRRANAQMTGRITV